MRLIVYRSCVLQVSKQVQLILSSQSILTTEAVEASRTEHDHYDHENKSKFWLVYSAIHSCQFETDPVVQRSADDFSNDAQDERAQSNQTCLANGEIVRGSNEYHAVDDREYDDPGESSTVYQETPKHAWIELVKQVSNGHNQMYPRT